MCVILFAFNAHPDRPLILAANRDEFYERPALAADYWPEEPNIFAGRDLIGGGTWLGVTRAGRFAAVSNYRDPSAPTGTRSRGKLVLDFLRSDERAEDYLDAVAARSDDYSGFNLLVGELSDRSRIIYYYSNRNGTPRKLDSGVYGLSNHLLDTPWPKVAKGKSRLERAMNVGPGVDKESLFELLADDKIADDSQLPTTGVPIEVERALSATFIRTPGYGTRCSTVLLFDSDLGWEMEERVFV